MGGSVIFQALWESYSLNMAQSATALAIRLLGAIAVTANGAVALYVILTGKRLLFGAMPSNEAATRLVRVVIVTALLSAANFQTFIATPITQTIPDWINNTVTGQSGLKGAQAWDALANAVKNFSAKTESQAGGIAYIAERIEIGFLAFACIMFLVIGFFIWSLAAAAADLMVPIIAVTLVFYLFAATRAIAERALMKTFSLLLIMLLTLALGQIVLFQGAQYVTKYANNIAAAPAAQGFNIAPDPDGVANGLLPTTPGAVAGTTVNVAAAIQVMWDMAGVFAYGSFLMMLVSGIALGIGASSGFRTEPMTRGIDAIARAVRGGGRR